MGGDGVKSALDSCVAWHGGRVGRLLHYNFAREKSLSSTSTSPNQPVHLTPEAGAFFAFAILEKNISFAKSSLASGAGDQHVRRDGPAGRNPKKE